MRAVVKPVRDGPVAFKPIPACLFWMDVSGRGKLSSPGSALEFWIDRVANVVATVLNLCLGEPLFSWQSEASLSK